MQQLAGQDASFLYVENDSIKSHFSILTLYDQSRLDQPLRYGDILNHFSARIAGLPVLRRKLYRVPLELDAPYFADDPAFSLEAHVRHIALPRPGDWQQLCLLAGQLQAQPLDLSKPLWDLHVIEGLDQVEGLPPGSFAILLRLHHAIADGTSARGILLALHQPADSPPLRAETATSALPPPSLAEMTLRGALNNARQFAELPGRLARLLPEATPLLGRLAASGLERWLGQPETPPATPADALQGVPDTLFNGPLDYRRVFQLRRFPLEQLQRLRALAPAATLNDVVLTLIGGALRRYLAALGERQRIDLIALCPINLRDDKLDSASQQGNHISLMQVNLHTRTTAPAKRLARVVAATRRGKHQQQAAGTRELIALSRHAPNLLLATGTRLALRALLRKDSTVRLANCIITNVPGPSEPLDFMGARLELVSALGPVTPSSGMIFPVTSYAGQLCIAFTACSEWIADPQQFADCLDESYADLLEALERSERPRPAPGTSPRHVAKPLPARHDQASAPERPARQRRTPPR